MSSGQRVRLPEAVAHSWRVVRHVRVGAQLMPMLLRDVLLPFANSPVVTGDARFVVVGGSGSAVPIIPKFAGPFSIPRGRRASS